MLLTTIRTVLVGAAPVTSICGDRVEILTKPQDIALPNVCLSIPSMTPINGLEGWNGLDGSLVQLSCYADTYTEARALAAACRAAMQDEYDLQDEFDNFEEGAELKGVPSVIQQWSAWS